MQAQTKAEEDADEEEVAEPGEEAGKDEADGQAEQEGAALSSGPAVEEEAVKEEGGAPEQMVMSAWLSRSMRQGHPLDCVQLNWLTDVVLLRLSDDKSVP